MAGTAPTPCGALGLGGKHGPARREGLLETPAPLSLSHALGPKAGLVNVLASDPLTFPPLVCQHQHANRWHRGSTTLYASKLELGEPGGNRTHDPRIKSPLLCLLSYGLDPIIQRRHPQVSIGRR